MYIILPLVRCARETFSFRTFGVPRNSGVFMDLWSVLNRMLDVGTCDKHGQTKYKADLSGVSSICSLKRHFSWIILYHNVRGHRAAVGIHVYSSWWPARLFPTFTTFSTRTTTTTTATNDSRRRYTVLLRGKSCSKSLIIYTIPFIAARSFQVPLDWYIYIYIIY